LWKIKEITIPSQDAWRGAARFLLGGLAVVLVISLVGILGAGGLVQTLMGILVMLGMAASAAALITLLFTLLGRLPFLYRMGLAATLLLTVLIGFLGAVYLYSILATSAALVTSFSLLGGGVQALRKHSLKPEELKIGQRIRIFGVTGGGGLLLALTLAWLTYPGSPLERPALTADEWTAGVLLDMPDPSQPGNYLFSSLCYGSLKGNQRGSCSKQPQIETQPVDGSAFVEGWSGLRRSYWGFGPEALPLQAKVWYPEGKGPFPLTLIVHCNALMEKPSDEGYDYLAELLASRGFIVASIDQNFLNLSFFSDLFILNNLKEENDARGWLLLEHLRLWHNWNDDPDSPFYNLVDLEQIALIGHSRGGEAVAAAAALNQFPYYPDNARVAFDYGYAIQAVAAIAPVDGQYKPGGMRTSLQDVNYLALHGAHDMDVVTYMAARQYERVRFSGDHFKFKAGLYIDGANHGQFNTVWGSKDAPEPLARFFNLRQLMPPEEQRQIARVYLTAFLEATLHDRRGYLPLFRDARVGSAWLPEGIYLNQYADSDTLLISDFEEDVDPSTTSLEGGSLQGHYLSVWYEKPLPARYGSTENRVVYLGWHPSVVGPASYDITLPANLEVGSESVLLFSLAATPEEPCPDEVCRKARPEIFKPSYFFDLTIEVGDRNGQVAKLPPSSYRVLRQPLETRLAKSPFSIVLPQSEIVLQIFEFPLGDFLEINRSFNPSTLDTVRLVFDRTMEGVLVLDHMGIRQE
jgi:hypothetical protein